MSSTGGDDWRGGTNPLRVHARRRAYENPWFWVEEHDVQNPDGAAGFYGVVRIRRLAVGVLPIEPDGRVHLVGQWRFPLGRYSWEMPEGGAEAGESALACARRELREETGLAAGKLTEILRLDLSNSLTDEQAVCFLASDLTLGPAAPEPSEVLQPLLVPFREVLARAVDGRISDAMTVAAVLRVHHMAVEGLLPSPLAAAILAS